MPGIDFKELLSGNPKCYQKGSGAPDGAPLRHLASTSYSRKMRLERGDEEHGSV